MFGILSRLLCKYGYEQITPTDRVIGRYYIRQAYMSGNCLDINLTNLLSKVSLINCLKFFQLISITKISALPLIKVLETEPDVGNLKKTILEPEKRY
jgi:hypothetical protein